MCSHYLLRINLQAMKFIKFLVFIYLLSGSFTGSAFTHADTLRGSNGLGRNWWDVRRYQLYVKFDTGTGNISGNNSMLFKVSATPRDSMQIDLQEPLLLDSVLLVPSIYSGRVQRVELAREGNVWWLKFPFSQLQMDSSAILMMFYHGKPQKAKNPPWDGGVTWKRDSAGLPFASVSCQGLGASIWWPCKDAQWEEPEDGMSISLEVPKGLMAISNGRQSSQAYIGDNTVTTWDVKNPINSYDVSFYIGDYVYWTDTLHGENGKLDLSYYVLRANEEKARKQFAVVKQMLHCFEHWMGPYPFYEDGYKLVEAPYLGMEHQSAIAYGNDYKMGYRGLDRSGSGHGLKWDYIIIHESGHEWFGNNVTAGDMADNWIHEGVTSYSEVLFTECLLGKEKAMKYSRGLWNLIRSDAPLIAPYGVNNEGTPDIYEKGEAVVHMLRELINDDEKFRKLLRGIGKEFHYSIVTTAMIEDYITKTTGLYLQPFFEQYLRRVDIPKLEYTITKNEISYRFNNVLAGFSLPISIISSDDSKKTLSVNVTGEWQKAKWTGGYNLKFSDNFLFHVAK